MISGASLHKVISQNQVKPVIKFRRKADLASKKPPTFHEIGRQAGRLYKGAAYGKGFAQKLPDHTSEEITKCILMREKRTCRSDFYVNGLLNIFWL
ncbi:hypothetical protein EAN55_07785 [Escherichia albertii]|nr:hypothetical protein [Escherichia albertii]